LSITPEVFLLLTTFKAVLNDLELSYFAYFSCLSVMLSLFGEFRPLKAGYKTMD
jgi:hypothetical protein